MIIGMKCDNRFFAGFLRVFEGFFCDDVILQKLAVIFLESCSHLYESNSHLLESSSLIEESRSHLVKSSET
jgi:hypothetical protein